MRNQILMTVLLLASWAGLAGAGWQDVSGAKIKGKPMDVLGPFALFRDSVLRGQRVLLKGLTPEDCVRLRESLGESYNPGPTFAEATGIVTSRLAGRLEWMRDQELTPADLSQQAEPEIIVFLFGHPHNGKSWRGLGNLVSTYHRLKRVMGDRIEFVFVGAVHEPSLQKEFAERSFMPWLVANEEVGDRLRSLSRLANSRETRAIVVSRNGAPILASSIEELADGLKFIDQLGDFVGLLNPANPKAWPHRKHYLSAVRPVEHAREDAPAVMVGSPLWPYSIRKYGVEYVEADLAIDPAGKVTGVTWLPGSVVPEKVMGPIENALQRGAVFVPALAQGTPVASTYRYELPIPAENRELEADLAWWSGEPMQEIILKSWLVLRPIQVTEDDFSQVAYTAADGTLVMESFEVSDMKFTRKEQMSAFSTNWFDDTGAGSVAAQEGGSVKIMGETLQWERMENEIGLIDFQQGLGDLEFTIGYAWIEFDMPKAMSAWLGIGSDDGIKIWHNDDLVHDKWIQRISRIDDDIVPLKLVEGRNRLLVKIQNVEGDWSFVSRMRIKTR